MERNILHVGEFIRDTRCKAKLSVRRLSALAGVSNPYLSQIERGLRRPSADVLQKVVTAMASTLRTTADALYSQAGIDPDAPPSESPTDVLGTLWKDSSLTDGQRKTLAETYERMRIETAERRAKRPRGSEDSAEGAIK